MASRMGMRPTAADIAAWGLEVIPLPVVPGATGWADRYDADECGHCGDSLVCPARPDGAIHDGDPAVCVWCGLVYFIASSSFRSISSARAVLREDDHARLYDVLAGETDR